MQLNLRKLERMLPVCVRLCVRLWANLELREGEEQDMTEKVIKMMAADDK